mgnify:CR=1 FL=1|jgi:hypothetical protein
MSCFWIAASGTLLPSDWNSSTDSTLLIIDGRRRFELRRQVSTMTEWLRLLRWRSALLGFAMGMLYLRIDVGGSICGYEV